MNMETPERIIDFWFGSAQDAADIATQQQHLWWGKSADTDANMRARFVSMVDAAGRGDLDAWRATPAGRLALILLTDQFPRNLYRDTPRAFSLDPLARQLCREGLTLRHDQDLRPIERVFFYLPLEHSEALDDQVQCVALLQHLVETAAAAHRALFEGYLDFAVRHHGVVERFGRFPHRNRILDRADTAAEHAFLQQPDSHF